MRRLALLPLLLVLTPALHAADMPRQLGTRITRAGNLDDDAERLVVLREIQALPGLDPTLKADADAMAAAVALWVDGRDLAYFGGQIGRTMDYDFKIRPDSPFYPLTRIYRGRMLTALVVESGGLIGNANRRRPYLDKAVAEFKAYAAAFPENRIARMYLGQPIPNPRSYPAPEGAPQWAVLQRENLERLADVVQWWIDHRMRPDGQFGGGWGDDCEMWRSWVPVLIAFDDPRITAAQTRFSTALMNQPHLQAGYTRILTDVEHSAEDTADVITPMMHLEPDNALWKARALKLADFMERLWTGRNERGQLQFKSTYFCCDRVDQKPQRACDTVYHPRTVQPTLLLWQRTGDPRLGRLFADWMDTWVDATARAERGKPAGVIPSAIHWPDGAVGGTSPDWWDPRNHGEATLYRWPSAMSMLCNTLLLTWHMTNNEKYLQPLRSMADVRRRWLRQKHRGPMVEGTAEWCAAHMSFLNGTWAKYRKLTGSTEFDDLLSPADRGDFAAGDRQELVKRLAASAESMRINFEGYTGEVRYTDRLLRFPRLFSRDMLFAEPNPAIHAPDPALLYTSATGDPGDAGYMPLAAVRWLTPPREIAALVTATGRHGMAAELYHFGPQPRNMGAELYLLDPGKYRYILRPADGSTASSADFAVKGQRTRIAVTLPSRKLCTLEVKLKGQ
jgi:hypothetical protein